MANLDCGLFLTKAAKMDGKTLLAHASFSHGEIGCVDDGKDDLKLIISMNRTSTEVKIPRGLWNLFIKDAKQATPTQEKTKLNIVTSNLT